MFTSTGCLRERLLRVPVVVDFAAEVGPEFFGEVADGVEKDVGAPEGVGVCRCVGMA